MEQRNLNPDAFELKDLESNLPLLDRTSITGQKHDQLNLIPSSGGAHEGDLSNAQTISQPSVQLPLVSVNQNKAISVHKLGEKLKTYLSGMSMHLNDERSQDEILEIGRQVTTLPDTVELKLQLLRMLTNLHKQWFDRLHNLEALELSIDFGAKAASLMHDNDPHKPDWLNFMGILHRKRHDISRKLGDLQKAIDYGEQAVALAPDDNLKKPIYQSGLGMAHLYLFRNLGKPENIERALAAMQQGVLLAPDGDPLKGTWLNNLGNCYRTRFYHFEADKDITESIDCLNKAVMQTPDHHKSKPRFLNNLGHSYLSRFERFGNLKDLEDTISSYQKAVQLTSSHDPSRLFWLHDLGTAYKFQFECTGKLVDIEEAIKLQEKSVQACSDSHPKKPTLLVDLGNSYASISDHLGRPYDINRASDCYLRAVQLTPDYHQEKSERLGALGLSHWCAFERLGKSEDLEKAIKFQTEALLSASEGHSAKRKALYNLGNSYWSRFKLLGTLRDLDQAISHKSQAVVLIPNDHPAKADELNNLGNSYRLLFWRLGQMADLEKAIKYHNQAVQLATNHNSSKRIYLNNLGTLYLDLFEQQGKLEDVNKSINYHEQAMLFTPDNHTERSSQLNSLGTSYSYRFKLFGKQDDFEKADSFMQQALLLTPNTDPGKPGFISSLGNLYRYKFWSSDRPEDFKKSVDYFQQAASLTPDSHPQKLLHLYNLGDSYRIYFWRSKSRSDRANAVDYFKQAAAILAGGPMMRFRAARAWAELACAFQGLDLEAYSRCMELLPQVVWLGVPVYRRYESLTREIKSLATEAASGAIFASQYALAIEWLEQGRSVVWNQTLSLRTPFDNLHEVSPDVAKQLKQVSWNLEQLSLPDAKDHFPLQDSASLHDVAQTHRRLAEDWEKLLDKARCLPGFNDFLRPPNISKLRHLTQGSVVVINVSTSRCDALILQGDDDVLHVPLINFSYLKAANARDQWVGDLQNHSVRRSIKWYSPESAGDSFGEILAMLWYDVVHPIIGCLGYNRVLPVDELPRITWCPTGPLSFLPLHAAGDYNSPSTMLVNLAVSSYTPTLTALRPTCFTSNVFSGILTVGQSSTPGQHSLPGTKTELEQIKCQAGALPLTELTGERACINTVLEALEGHSWVHFACHASQNTTDPLQSAFHLHDGALDLATIAKKSLKNAQLAFLSACQTAAGDQTVPEESVHLAAGLLVAGYPSVIATMWSIHDGDAPLVAGEVYKCLLEGGLPDSGKAVVALHNAVAQLRAQVGEQEFARWVPFVHFGR